MRTLPRAIFSLILTAGCGSGPKAHPTSAAAHERAAEAHEAEAEGIENQCWKARRNELTTPVDAEANTIERLDKPGEPCWKAQDKRFLDAHRDAAAKHRAASTELRAAEASACAGFSVDDRVISPFERTSEIAGVEPFVRRTDPYTAGSRERVVGAVVTFRAVPGMTTEWLQRLVDCHLARNAALGHVVPEMPNCPLVPAGVRARVRPAGTGFAVEIDSDDPDVAREILARAERLAPSARTSQR